MFCLDFIYFEIGLKKLIFCIEYFKYLNFLANQLFCNYNQEEMNKMKL